MVEWIRCGGGRAATVPRKAVVRTLAKRTALIWRPLLVCVDKAAEEGRPLGSLHRDTMALVSSFLDGQASAVLAALVRTGRIHNDLLVAMARFSCHGRRLVLRDGRPMASGLFCHRHYCRWRRCGLSCPTIDVGYTRSSYLRRRLTRTLPRGCWEGTVHSADQDSPIPFAPWVLDTLERRHSRLIR